MKKEELESLGFDKAYLEESINEGGERRVQIESEDFEVIKTLLEYGGIKAVDAYLDATWSAWYCAQSLIHAVDGLFHSTKFGLETETYSGLVEKMIGSVIDDMKLALINAETETQYDDDPLDKAENFIRGFGDDLAHRLERVKSD